MRVNNGVYRKGLDFLLASQYPDGSWLVRTRAFPVQPYFESGFPFDRHQWISAAGTGWAAKAIALTLPGPRSVKHCRGEPSSACRLPHALEG